MGNLFSKKVEPQDELEKIVEQVKTIESNIESLRQQEKFISRFLMTSIFMGILAVAVDYIYKKPKISTMIVLVLALVIFIILYLLVRILLTRFYSYRTNKRFVTKETLIKKKMKIMEEIKEKVNFNVARELILKYGDEEDIKEVDNVIKPKSSPNGPATPLMPNKKAMKPTPPNTLPQPSNQKGEAIGKQMPFSAQRPMPPGGFVATPKNIQRPLETPKAVRPFVGAARTPVDKLVDFVIGDGPNNRYALICNNCFTHNGMALPGEYERLSYYCYKCNTFNPSKQKRTPSVGMRGNSADPGSAVKSNSFVRRPSDATPEQSTNTLRKRSNVINDEKDEENGKENETKQVS